MKLSKTKHFVYITMLAAMAIAINLLETMLTVSLPFGMRLGLANIIALITIEILGVKEMIIVNTMRVVIGNLLRGTIFGSTFWISAGGVILSSIVLIIFKKGLKMSMISTSMLCAIGHSVGQVVIVMVLYKTAAMMTIVPLLLVTSIPTGIFTGIVAAQALKRIDKNLAVR